MGSLGGLMKMIPGMKQIDDGIASSRAKAAQNAIGSPMIGPR